MKKIVFLVITITFFSALLYGEDMLRIRVLKKFKPQEITVYKKEKPSAKTKITRDNGFYYVQTPYGEKFIKKYMYLFGQKNSTYVVKTGRIKREYTGMLELIRKPNAQDITLVLNTKSENYIPGVLAVEAEQGVRADESIKALSVVARTFAYDNKWKHKKYGYNLCDTTHCQKFNGIPKRNSYWQRFADDTSGIVIKSWDDKAIAFYSANCGGTMESADNIWAGGNDPAEEDVVKGEVMCSKHHDYEWKSTLMKTKVNKVLRDITGDNGIKVKKMFALEHTPGGRVTKIKFMCYGLNEYVVDAYKFMASYGRANGWKTIPSLLFTVENKWFSFEIKGNGYGHGAGMCMAGAYRMAKKGYSYERIISHYFSRGDMMVMEPELTQELAFSTN